MKLSAFVTALIVSAGIYLFIMERDTLRAFAGVDTEVEIKKEDLAAKSNAVPVQVMESEATSFQSAMRLRGRTEAFRSVHVAAEISGSVISAPLRKGRQVTQGDIMCQLDPGTSEAALAEARAQLAEAEANNNVSTSLVERGFASETTVIARQAALESAEAAVRRAEQDVERLTIRAPFDGILETDTAELGSLLQPGSPCATLISLDPIKLVGFATEEQVTQIELGAIAGARLVTGSEVVGEITFVSRSSDPQTRTFRVEMTAPNSDLSIRDGMTAEILIQLADREGHLLPQSALTLDDDGRLGVRVAEAGVARFFPVEVLRETSDGVWLTGLPEMADVIVIGQEYVNDGRAINATPLQEGL